MCFLKEIGKLPIIILSQVCSVYSFNDKKNVMVLIITAIILILLVMRPRESFSFLFYLIVSSVFVIVAIRI